MVSGGKPNQSTSIPLTHEIVQALPKGLPAIIEAQEAIDPSLKARSGTDEKANFFTECDVIRAWENRCNDEIQSHDMKWTFVNHSAPDQPVYSPVAYWLLVNYAQDGIPTEKPSFEAVSWPPFVTALKEAELLYAPSPAVSIQSDDSMSDGPSSPASAQSGEIPEESTSNQMMRRNTNRRKRRLNFEIEDVPFTPPRKRNRARRDSLESDEPGTPPRKALETAAKRRALTYFNRMSARELYRFNVTTICIRTLRGGVQGSLDWCCIRSLLPIHHDEELLEHCWTYNMQKHDSEIQTLTESFQEKYLAALQDDQVPTVDFENLQATDWGGIVTWALKALDTRVGQVNLPTTRADLLTKHDLSHDETPSIRSVFQTFKSVGYFEREELYRDLVFGDRSRQKSVSDGASMSSDRVSRLRSLVISLVFGSGDQELQHLIDTKFYSVAPNERAAELLMQPIIEQLRKDQLIAKRSGGPPMKGLREFTVAMKFFSHFGEKYCLVTADLLRDAARYKLVLDELLARGEPLEIPKTETIGAGQMLAMMQLLGMGMIEVEPSSDIPNSRYGADWQHVGYQSKDLGRGQLRFGVVISKSEDYVFGDVFGKRLSVDLPAGNKNNPLETPVWVEVHGKVALEIWEMVLGSVVGLISSRPGVSPHEISKSLGDAVGAWEVQLMLTWAEQAGFVQKSRSGRGWETKEWWWLCLGTGDVADEF